MFSKKLQQYSKKKKKLMNLHMCVEKRIQKRGKEKNKDVEYGSTPYE